MSDEREPCDPHLLCDVVIAGASFAGIEAYRRLRRTRAGRRLSVTIVDRQAQHGYIPLVHERLTLRLPDARSVLETARCIERDALASYVVGEIVSLEPVTGTLTLASGQTLRARFVIVALGSELAPPASLRGGEHLLRYKFGHELERARPRLLAQLRADGRVLVIGGGISGVELAGDLALVVKREQLRPGSVTLLEASERLLEGMHERVARHALRELEAQGVVVRLQTSVREARAGELVVEAGPSKHEEVLSGLSIWAAGVRPNPLLRELGLPVSGRGYLTVGPTLQCSTDAAATAAQVFACGDAVRVVVAGQEWPTMQRAIECLWQAKVVALNVLSLASERPPPALREHTLIRDFPYGISIGLASTIIYGRLMVELGALGVWFRRFLMFMYMRRYTHMRTVDRLPDHSAQRPG